MTAAQDEAEDWGLYFVFISVRAFDTIEFMQQEWINGGNFIDLGNEHNPIVGLQEESSDLFTIPQERIRPL